MDYNKLTTFKQSCVSEVMAATEKEREKLTLYKSDDDSFAILRLQTRRILLDVIVRIVTNTPQIKENKNFLDNWMRDSSDFGKGVVLWFISVTEYCYDNFGSDALYNMRKGFK